MYLRIIAISSLAGFLLSLPVYWFVSQDGTETRETSRVPVEVQAAAKPTVNQEVHIIADGDTFTSAMSILGFSYAEAIEVLEASADVYDFTSVKVGQPLRLVYDDSGKENRLEYDVDSETMIIVDLQSTTPEAREEAIPYDVRIETAEATITGSLFGAALNAGMNEAGVLKLAEVFAWNIDFASQVQAGDAFKVVYERRTRDGKDAGVGKILAASFTNNGEQYQAYRFEKEDGDAVYYNEEGKSLVRQFLKAPLKFSRVSSGFSYARFHPTLGRNMPHRAIDYAAPLGTPIRATADGTVIQAGWKGCFGNHIDVRHNGTYRTQYAHLSKIAVSSGQHVKQGEVIGYVGSTGCSTGPHLHYQLMINGELVDPGKAKLPAAGDPVSESQRPAFEEIKQKYQSMIE